MDKKYIIDSSASLAAIYDDNSIFEFKKYMPSSVMHIVSLSEVIAVLLRDGMETAMTFVTEKVSFTSDNSCPSKTG